jgi:hypothetical protein
MSHKKNRKMKKIGKIYIYIIKKEKRNQEGVAKKKKSYELIFSISNFF